MSTLQFTRHGFQRMCQRGFSDADIDLVMMFGSEVPEGYLLTRRDQDQAFKLLVAMADRLSRLQGAHLVAREGRLITGFHATKAQVRRKLRNGPKRRRRREG